MVATVPTACGIETKMNDPLPHISHVATVPTACGIETSTHFLIIGSGWI